MSAFELGRLIGWFIGPVLLVGGLAYVMRGGKVALMDGVRHPLVLTLIVLTIVANAIPQPANTPNADRVPVPTATLPKVDPVEPVGNVFTVEEASNFRSGCIESAAQSNGLEGAGTSCDCLIKEIEKTFSKSAFRAATAAAQTAGGPSNQMTDLVERCGVR